MGWRKLTIQDGDAARCSELQRPRRYAELRPWGPFNAAASQRGLSERTEAAGPGGPADVQFLQFACAVTSAAWALGRRFLSCLRWHHGPCAVRPARRDCACRLCYCHNSINQISNATGTARGSYGTIIAQLEVREYLDLGLLVGCVVWRCCCRRGRGRHGLGPLEGDWLDGQHVNVIESKFRRAIV